MRLEARNKRVKRSKRRAARKKTMTTTSTGRSVVCLNFPEQLLREDQLSGKRRVQVTEFKGNTMVGIREFYEKDGKMLPGKKVRYIVLERPAALTTD